MATFSSVQDRPRDKLLHEKHQKELGEKDRKIERLQRANDESWKRHFDAQARGNHFAQALGFHDIFEAQTAIDIAGHEMPYKECFTRVDTLRGQVSGLQAENSELLERITALEAENTRKAAENKSTETTLSEKKDLLARISSLETDLVRRAAERKSYMSQSKTTISRLEQELAQLQGRFDDLLDVKERAAERYKTDYAKWRDLKDWILREEPDYEGGSEEEKKRRYNAGVKSKKKMIREIEDGLEPTPTPYSKPPPLGGITNIQDNKGNTPPHGLTSTLSSYSTAQRIPSLQNKILDAVSQPKPPSSSPNLFNEGPLPRSLPPPPQDPPSGSHISSSPSPSDERRAASPRSSPTVVGTASRPLRNRVLESVAQSKVPLSSPVIFNTSSSSRKPLSFEPVVQSRSHQIEQGLGSSPLARKPGGGLPFSDTEEDSEPIDMGPPLQPTSPAPMLSSETEADSQSQLFPFPFLDPTPCPVRPAKSMLPPAPAHPSLPPESAFPHDRRVVSSRDTDTMQPAKVRRVNDENDADAATPRPRGEQPRRGFTAARKGKGREMEVPMSTPAQPSTKRIEDYSAYKGRGRYGKNSAASKDTGTINAQFEINTTRNGGLDFQYDEVVRGKNDRKRMDAGDCECCHDYYEAVGPLPKRLQAPLWKSPPSTPSKPCPHHPQLSASGSNSKGSFPAENTNSSGGRKRRQSEITSHKKAISRHRHHWERAKTPPGYWNIGFPDTQETEEINDQAREMHRRKRDEVEAAARTEDGRYRRRS